MKEELLKKLNELVGVGEKKSALEEKIGLPLNSLSAVLNGSKEMPDKWVDKINTYLTSLIPRTEMEVAPNGRLKVNPSKELKLALTENMEKINKDFGDGTVMFFGSKPNTDYEVIPTGSLLLDKALGIGGLPRGRMVEIYGKESSGKSTIALNVIANAQKMGLKCLLVDAENSFDPEYAETLGVQIDKLAYCQPTFGEQGFEVADRQIVAGEANVVVIDSVAAMIPKSELEGEMGDSKMGLHARLMSQVCRKMVGSVAKTNSLIIFINQIRNKIGAMYENPEVTTGGMALQFYASIRLHVSRSLTNENSIINNGVKEGNKTTVKVIKNKCAPPFRNAVFNIIYGQGIDRLGEIIEMAVEYKIIEKAGSWFSYEGNKLGQGKDSVIDVLSGTPELLAEIENNLLEKLKNN